MMTKAGAALLERIHSLNGRSFPLATVADIAAIEAEARAAALADVRKRVEERVEELPTTYRWTAPYQGPDELNVVLGDVLRAIEEATRDR